MQTASDTMAATAESGTDQAADRQMPAAATTNAIASPSHATPTRRIPTDPSSSSPREALVS